jgi:hypothetical protein
MSPRVELARRILETIAQGHQVSVPDALQLRDWAVRPEHAMLPLEKIARRILDDQGYDSSEGKEPPLV